MDTDMKRWIADAERRSREENPGFWAANDEGRAAIAKAEWWIVWWRYFPLLPVAIVMVTIHLKKSSDCNEIMGRYLS